MKPGFDHWTIIFLLSAAQGLFLSAVLFSRRSNVNNLLSGVMFLFSVMLIYYVTFWTGYYQELPRYLSIIGGLTFLFAPLLYFYIRSGKGTFYFNKWHGIPFLVYILSFFIRPVFSENIAQIVGLLTAMAQCIHLVIYSYLMYSQLEVYNKNNKVISLKNKIAYSFMGYSATFLLYYILVWTGNLKLEYDYMISLASSFFIYFVGYISFKNPDAVKYLESSKYEKTSLSPSASQSILKRIEEHMALNKPYLNSDMKLNDLADKLSISQNHVSQVINELTDQNFSDFINKYRIEEAKSVLNNSSTANIKLIHLALDVGFNNKNSFYNAFKKYTNYSPSAYQHDAVSNKGLNQIASENGNADFSRNIAN